MPANEIEDEVGGSGLLELREQVDDRSAKIRFLLEMTSVLVNVSSAAELFAAIAQKAQELLPYEICSTHLVDWEKQRVSVVLAHAPVEAKWQGRSLPLGEGIVGTAAQSGQLVRVDDVSGDPRWIKSTAEIRSELAVPIKSEGRVIAVLNLESSRTNAFGQYDEQIFSILAAQIGAALERFHLHQQTVDRASRLQALNRLAREIAGEPDVDRIFEVVADELNFIIQADRVTLSLYDPLTDELEVIGMQGIGAEHVGLGHRYSVHDAITQAEGPVVRWTMKDTTTLERLLEAGIQVVMTVPIRLDDAFVAELNLGFTDQIRLPDSPQVEFLWALSAHMAVVLKSARLYRDLRKSAQELRETQNKLLQSAKLSAVGELAAGVAHELNNPLTGILGYTQYCLMSLKAHQGESGEDELGLAERLGKIEREVLRCKEIVQNLLNFSRAHDRASYESVSLNDVVRNTLNVLEHQLTTHQINVNIELDPSLPAVHGNSNHLQQVFTNIVINAQKAMIEDGQLTIRTGYDAANAMVFAAFADNGPGIDQEIQSRIFDPFFTTRKVGEGTGLGLSVSYGLITDHGGRITVDSEIGEGATFTVFLPAIVATTLDPE